MPIGIKFVQFQKNSSYHSGIKCSPYAALFGCDARIGLTSSSIPNELISTVNSEADLFAVFQNFYGSVSTPATDSEEAPSVSEEDRLFTEAPLVSEEAPLVPNEVPHISEKASSVSEVHIFVSEEARLFTEAPRVSEEAPLVPNETPHISEEASSDIDLFVSEDSSRIMEQTAKITKRRQEASNAQRVQAERMVKRSRIDLQAGTLCDNVAVPIPAVDRGRGDARNMLGVIVDKTDSDQYKIAVKCGVLNGHYSRNQFDLCPQWLLSMSDVSFETQTSLRQAVCSESSAGGQGFVKCNCSGSKRCQTNRCKCFKAKLQCNSR